ncbi:MAG: AAA family ATPase [Bacteroidetes bacterium]|nr:AAA family ATPase [Bacteroidota bacterium]
MEKTILIGREKEKKTLLEILGSKESEFVAIYGRRRVGKTFLIDEVYKEHIVFEISGLNKGNKQLQLENFTSLINQRLEATAKLIQAPQSWLQAFFILQKYLDKLPTGKKHVVFFDELPWLAKGKSDFLAALENFWNSWASKRRDIILVVCGSAASWMITKIVKSRGGLHNRITRRIRLMPFNLYETELYLQSRNIQLDRYSILQIYMVMGGIPHYLKEIRRGKSAPQIIDEICFSQDGLLYDEFLNLYEALFSQPEKYIDVIKALAQKPKGLTRNEIIANCNLSSGGTTTKILESLEESGFIVKYFPIGKNLKLSIYKLSDPYSAFYLKFIENSKSKRPGSWLQKSASPSWRSWSGLAFERLCLAHIPQIKHALGISGVYSEESSWRSPGKEEQKGAQIDLIIDRADNVINLFEIKFSQGPFVINKQYAEDLQNKIFAFRQDYSSRKSIFLAMITTFGLVENQYSTSLIHQSLKMDVLFEK